jgi:predicted nucleic acid-binding protein
VIVLDACVLAAFADKSNTLHQRAVAIMAGTGTFVISALTGAEVMVPDSVEQPTCWPEILAAFGIQVIDFTAADMSRLAITRRESRLKMPDAIVLDTARRLNASVATFDIQLLKAAAALGIPTHS